MKNSAFLRGKEEVSLLSLVIHSFIHSFPIQISNAACCWLGAVLESRAVQVEKIEQCLCGNAGQRWEG